MPLYDRELWKARQPDQAASLGAAYRAQGVARVAKKSERERKADRLDPFENSIRRARVALKSGRSTSSSLDFAYLGYQVSKGTLSRSAWMRKLKSELGITGPKERALEAGRRALGEAMIGLFPRAVGVAYRAYRSAGGQMSEAQYRDLFERPS